eukprot:TRINITY_DN11646_c0_g1_i1.p1 TRINITY_DN11646_c0_g1~~TRINITY_DN11646_c0_g1_i1.p1  ORF type:complete len:168 (+),score=5.40 TRINITY_DN11646_c0_g1_i1:263-766(+)
MHCVNAFTFVSTPQFTKGFESSSALRIFVNSSASFRETARKASFPEQPTQQRSMMSLLEEEGNLTSLIVLVSCGETFRSFAVGGFGLPGGIFFLMTGAGTNGTGADSSSSPGKNDFLLFLKVFCALGFFVFFLLPPFPRPFPPFPLPEIGRAVQQECRDRSRMPSSA